MFNPSSSQLASLASPTHPQLVSRQWRVSVCRVWIVGHREGSGLLELQCRLVYASLYTLNPSNAALTFRHFFWSALID